MARKTQQLNRGPEQLDLFRETAPSATPATGWLVTSDANLMYMLAAGLIMPPAGFGPKYYRDALTAFPGWIPLFRGAVTKEALGLATEEAGHLKPVIAEVPLDDLEGKVYALRGSTLSEIRLPMPLADREEVLLIPAPLPAAGIRSILFSSQAHLEAFQGTASDYSNVPAGEIEPIIRETLYRQASDGLLRNEGSPLKRDVSLEALNAPLAAGGIMAMLLRLSHKGDMAVEVCQLAFGAEVDLRRLSGNPILVELPAWMRAAADLPSPGLGLGTCSGIGDPVLQKHLFWGFVQRLWQRDRHEGASAVDILLGYLQEAAYVPNNPGNSPIAKLTESLSQIVALPNATTSELLERHSTPLERALILFCLRRKCSELLGFRSEQLTEEDWLAAGILFGARDSWLSLPLDLRSGEDLPAGALAKAVSHRMAQMSHRISNSGLNLSAPPPLPRMVIR